MIDKDCLPEKDDYLDVGKMDHYDSPIKPCCHRCDTGTFMVAAGRDTNWVWKCTNCQSEYQPYVSIMELPAERGD